jgi:hypothetical protein
MSSILRASGIADLPAPLVVCCHDAGGANLIAAWIAADWQGECRVCVEGPAREIFARRVPHLVPMSLSAAMNGASALLSGSGWASDLEHDARVAARQAGVPAWAALDHWVNYPMRFTRHGQQCLPDVFVVTDADAARIAAESFGTSSVIQTWPNRYLEGEVAGVHAVGTHVPRSPARRLLVILEPVRVGWSADAMVPAEFRALDYLMDNLATVTPAVDDLLIRLRLHPSETPAKYQPWIGAHARLRLEVSTSSSLAEDIAWADVVAGLQSYALLVALTAQRRAISYLPPEAPPCPLRHSALERL